MSGVTFVKMIFLSAILIAIGTIGLFNIDANTPKIGLVVTSLFYFGGIVVLCESARRFPPKRNDDNPSG